MYNMLFREECSRMKNMTCYHMNIFHVFALPIPVKHWSSAIQFTAGTFSSSILIEQMSFCCEFEKDNPLDYSQSLALCQAFEAFNLCFFFREEWKWSKEFQIWFLYLLSETTNLQINFRQDCLSSTRSDYSEPVNFSATIVLESTNDELLGLHK